MGLRKLSLHGSNPHEGTVPQAANWLKPSEPVCVLFSAMMMMID